MQFFLAQNHLFINISASSLQEVKIKQIFIGVVDIALGFEFSLISLLVYSEQFCWGHLRKSVQVHGAGVSVAEWELLGWCTSGQAKQEGSVCLTAIYRNANLSGNW